MIDPTDRGFTLGDGAFETMRCSGGRIFRLDAHLKRLEGALDKLQIPTPPDLVERLQEACRDPGERGIRLTVTRGPSSPGLMPPDHSKPTTVLVVSPIAPPPAALTAKIVSGRRNEKAAGVGWKLLGYTEGILGLLEAREAGAMEALFLDTEGHLSEASASNLFLVRGEDILTPPKSCGILPGVTRELVFELEPTAREAVLRQEDLWSADEVFLTSTLRGVTPLVQVDGVPIGSGRPGPVTDRIAQAVRELVARECGSDAAEPPNAPA